MKGNLIRTLFLPCYTLFSLSKNKLMRMNPSHLRRISLQRGSLTFFLISSSCPFQSWYKMHMKINALMISKENKRAFKVGLSPSKNFDFICFNVSPLKVAKNAFYFILKALFVLKTFKFLFRSFWLCGKTA